MALAEEVYFGKAKDVVGELRSKFLRLSDFGVLVLKLILYSGVGPLSETNRDRATQQEMLRGLQR